MDKTLKTRAYAGDSMAAEVKSNLSEAQEKALELAKKNAMLEEVRIKSLEYLNTIEHLQESLKLEQAKAAEMAKKIAALESKTSGSAEQETSSSKLAELEAKVKELSDLLRKISDLASPARHLCD